jgi:hypothetical protein
MRLEFIWRISRQHEGIVSGGKVNRLINGFVESASHYLANVWLVGEEHLEQRHGDIDFRSVA